MQKYWGWILKLSITGGGGFFVWGGYRAEGAMLVPDLHFAVISVLWFLWRKKQMIHAFTFTSCLLQHGVMYGVWRKTEIPQSNRRRKQLQTQNRMQIASSLVAILKAPHPHKEQKQRQHQKTKCPRRQQHLRKQYIQSNLRHPAERHHRWKLP